MGNNATVTVRNITNGTNYSIPAAKKKFEFIPPMRGPQTYEAVSTQVMFLIVIAAGWICIMN